MKIFVSWSGVRSKYIAEQLHWFIPNVLQAAEPFISTRDIRKGTRGNVVIYDNLEEANVGIICLTPENIDKPWILFEAGALSKQKSALVCTMLYDIEWTDVPRPLGEFQHTRFAKDELIALVKTINDELPLDRRVKPDRLQGTIDTWLPQLEERLAKVPERPKEEQVVEPPDPSEQMKEVVGMLRTLLNQRTVHVSGTIGKAQSGQNQNLLMLPMLTDEDNQRLHEAMTVITNKGLLSEEQKKLLVAAGLATHEYAENPTDGFRGKILSLTPAGERYYQLFLP